MTTRLRLLLAIAVTASVCAAMIYVGITGPLRVVFGAALALPLPGTALMFALLPKRPMSFAERVLYAVALGLSSLVLGALVLNLTPQGLRTETWAVWLGVVTVIGCAIAAVGARIQDEPDWVPDVSDEEESAPSQLPTNALSVAVQGGVIGLALLVTLGAFVFSRMEAKRSFFETPITQLWLLPVSEKNTTTKSASPVAPKSLVKAKVGIHITGVKQLIFRLQLMHGGSIIKEWDEIKLQPNQTWESEVTIDMLAAGVQDTPLEPVQALLYGSDSPTVVLRRASMRLVDDTVETGKP